MKKLFLILALFFSSSGYAQDFLFSPLNPNNNSDRQIISAKNQAVVSLRDFISTLKPTDNPTMLETMISALNETPITKRNKISAVIQNNPCNIEGVIAYVPFIPTFMKIFRLCTSEVSLLSFEGVTQLFIHESFHVAEGMRNEYYDRLNSEAGALMLEANIMNKLKGCSYIDYDYFQNPTYKAAIQAYKVKKLPLCR